MQRLQSSAAGQADLTSFLVSSLPAAPNTGGNTPLRSPQVRVLYERMITSLTRVYFYSPRTLQYMR